MDLGGRVAIPMVRDAAFLVLSGRPRPLRRAPCRRLACRLNLAPMRFRGDERTNRRFERLGNALECNEREPRPAMRRPAVRQGGSAMSEEAMDRRIFLRAAGSAALTAAGAV